MSWIFSVHRTLYAKLVTSFLKYLEPIGENLRCMIAHSLIHAGFCDFEEPWYENTLFGTLSYYRSKKPE